MSKIEPDIITKINNRLRWYRINGRPKPWTLYLTRLELHELQILCHVQKPYIPRGIEGELIPYTYRGYKVRIDAENTI